MITEFPACAVHSPPPSTLLIDLLPADVTSRPTTALDFSVSLLLAAGRIRPVRLVPSIGGARRVQDTR